ncbi:ribonuclease H-like domain-containing protein [Tanacetum coccineum]|uniref:Ribonuclease H-like domain-containing protein n=1 Tax=Tanacetum coccineum TaxID=301880 RepID=A0ABQ5HI94_9ASTR
MARSIRRIGLDSLECALRSQSISDIFPNLLDLLYLRIVIFMDRRMKTIDGYGRIGNWSNSSEAAAPRAEVLADSPVSTSIDQDAPSTSIPSSQEHEQSPIISQEDHLAKFHKMTDAKEMWNAIKSRFGGNDESKKMQKYILKQQFEGFSVSNTDGIHKGYERFQSLLSQLEIHGAGVSTEDANQKFLRSLPSAWAVLMMFSTAYVFTILWSKRKLEQLQYIPACKGHFARECRTKEDNRRRDGWNTGNKDGSRTGKKEESRALVTVDGECVDWTTHSEDDENYAFMASNSSGSNTQREELSDASIEIKAYTQALKKVEAQLVTHQQGQLWDKFGLGYGDYRYSGILSYENEVMQSVFKCNKSDSENTTLHKRINETSEMHAVSPPMTGNYLPSGPDVEIDDSQYTYDSDDECVTVQTKGNDTPSFANKQVKTPRENVKKQSTHSQKPKVNNKELGNGFTERGCFVCGSFSHLIKDCDYHVKLAKQVELKQYKIWSKVQTRTENNPVQTAKASSTKKVSTARQKVNRQTVLTSTALKVKTVKPNVNDGGPANVFHKTHSPSSRPFKRTTDNPHRNLQNKGIIDSGCSRHMTGNKAYLADFQDFNGGPVAFGGSKGYITGKGKIKTGKLDFEDVSFVKELQPFNLFSVSQMCDKKNKVLFTDTECLVLSPDFKLPDENQILLKVPRQNNMYSFNLENIVPLGEFKNSEVIEFCGLKGIKREYSNARTPQQNGVAERKNKTLIEAARTMLADSFLPNTFWAKAVSTACYVLNRIRESKLTFMHRSTRIYQNTDKKRRGPREEEQVFLDDLARLQMQEKEANEEAEALRKDFQQGLRTWYSGMSLLSIEVYQMDVKSAFLYGKIDEEVYVSQPPCFLDSKCPQKVYKVVKALYGLHQAPRACIGFVMSLRHYCKSRFQMSSMGELTFFLGLQVKQKPDGIFISQDKYVAEILKKFDFGKVNDWLLNSMYLKGENLHWALVSRVSSFDLDSTQIGDMLGANLDRKSQQEGGNMNGSSMDKRGKTHHGKSNLFQETPKTYVAAASCCGQVLWIQNQMLDYGFNFMKLDQETGPRNCVVPNRKPKDKPRFKCKNSLVKHFEYMRLCRPSKEYLQVWFNPPRDGSISYLTTKRMHTIGVVCDR